MSRATEPVVVPADSASFELGSTIFNALTPAPAVVPAPSFDFQVFQELNAIAEEIDRCRATAH